MSLVEKLTTERRSRLAAERLLELKQAELFAANRKLGIHAQQLSEEIVETRAEVETIRGENQRSNPTCLLRMKRLQSLSVDCGNRLRLSAMGLPCSRRTTK